MEYLPDILGVCLPFIVFVIVARQMFRQAKPAEESGVLDEEKVSDLFREYFSVTDEPLIYTFPENGGTAEISLEPASDPVESLDDVFVYYNGIRLSDYRGYIGYRQRFSGQVAGEIGKIAADPKKKKELIDAAAENASAKRTIPARTSIRTINELRDEIRDWDVKDALDDLMRSLVRLKESDLRYGSGEESLKRLYDRYLVILSRILAQYLLLEDSGNPAETQKMKEKLIGLIGTVNDAVDKINASLSEDEFLELRTEMEALSAKVELDVRQQAGR